MRMHYFSIGIQKKLFIRKIMETYNNLFHFCSFLYLSDFQGCGIGLVVKGVLIIKGESDEIMSEPSTKTTQLGPEV